MQNFTFNNPTHIVFGKGRIPELAKLMRRCSVCVLPSFYEGLPLVLIEALACGCRLIATSLPGIKEQLAPRLGSALELVPLPKLKGIDTPSPEGLAAFVDDLTTAIETAIGKPPLDFSRQAAPRKTVVDMNEIVSRALDILDRQMSVNNIDTTKALTEPLPAVRVDPNQMVQVLVNLLVNAADSIGSRGGEIFVGTDLEESTDGTWVRIKVSDSGSGIAPEDLERIFDPFFTTKGDGTGLGLAICHSIVEAHGGEIEVDSKPGEGTRVTITL